MTPEAGRTVSGLGRPSGAKKLCSLVFLAPFRQGQRGCVALRAQPTRRCQPALSHQQRKMAVARTDDLPQFNTTAGQPSARFNLIIIIASTARRQCNKTQTYACRLDRDVSSALQQRLFPNTNFSQSRRSLRACASDVGVHASAGSGESYADSVGVSVARCAVQRRPPFLLAQRHNPPAIVKITTTSPLVVVIIIIIETSNFVAVVIGIVSAQTHETAAVRKRDQPPDSRDKQGASVTVAQAVAEKKGCGLE
eukprot:251997-Rhodomonas_salina.5